MVDLGTDEGLRQRVRDHDMQLVRIETILERLVESTDKIADATQQQNLLILKITNLEAKVTDNSLVLEEKIRERKEGCDEIKQELEELKKITRVIVFISQYPKVALFTFIGLYVFAIQEIRYSVFPFLAH